MPGNKNLPFDSSLRTSLVKRRVIIRGQVAKNPTLDVTKKPFIGQFHLTDGFTNGIVDYRFSNGLNLITKF